MIHRACAFAALLLCSSTALAQECPIPAGADPKLAQVDAATRLNYLRLSLNEDAKLASHWKWGWVMGFGFVGAFNLANAANSGAGLETKSADYVGAVASGISIIPLVAHPLGVVRDGPAFDAKVKAATPTEVCALIKEGELLLEKDAEGEAAGKHVVPHVISLVYNLATAAVIGFAFHSWSSAGLTGGIGIVLGEAMIQTQPAGLVNASKTYSSGNITAPIAPTALGFSIRPTGLGVAGTF